MCSVEAEHAPTLATTDPTKYFGDQPRKKVDQEIRNFGDFLCSVCVFVCVSILEHITACPVSENAKN